MSISRRELFRTTAAAVATFGVIGLTRKSGRADGPARAKRVLILNASGGLRSSAAFNASTMTRENPWGMLGTFGVCKLGKLVVSEVDQMRFDTASWAGVTKVPGIEEAAKGFSIIGAVDHAPGLPRAGDHTDEEPRMGTGYYGLPAPGLLTVLGKHFDGQDLKLPVSVIGASGAFGAAAGDWARFEPVYLDPFGMPNGDSVAPPRGLKLEEAIDRGTRARVAGLSAQRVDAFLAAKRAMRRYGPALTNPALNLRSAANNDVAVDGITNRMLLEALGNEVTATNTGDGTGVGLALAIRMLQLGSPAVGFGLGGFDLHSEEKQKAPLLYTKYARLLAGLHFALSRIPDGTRTMLDTTLVVTASEFNRSAPAPGFNSGDGSDHIDEKDMRKQAHVVFGAGIKPKAIAETNAEQTPVKDVFSTHALLSTIGAAVGAPQVMLDAVWPSGTQLHPEKDPLFQLWA